MTRTGRRGTDNVTLRIERERWDLFGTHTANRSGTLRDFIRWYNREEDAPLPRRPRVRTRVGDEANV